MPFQITLTEHRRDGTFATCDSTCQPEAKHSGMVPSVISALLGRGCGTRAPSQPRCFHGIAHQHSNGNWANTAGYR